METHVINHYRGYDIVEIVTCGEIQGYFGESTEEATRFYTPAAVTIQEIKEKIDKAWEIHYSYKKLEYKSKGRTYGRKKRSR